MLLTLLVLIQGDLLEKLPKIRGLVQKDSNAFSKLLREELSITLKTFGVDIKFLVCLYFNYNK